MPKKKGSSSRRRNYDYKTIVVRVPANIQHLIDDVLEVPTLNQVRRKNRHTTVPLVSRGRTVRKRVTLAVPRERQLPAKVALDRYGNLRHYSISNMERTNRYEQNRRRKQERKRKSRRSRSAGHLSSIRSDRFGVVSANRRSSIERFMDSAMVARALEFKYRRKLL